MSRQSKNLDQQSHRGRDSLCPVLDLQPGTIPSNREIDHGHRHKPKIIKIKQFYLENKNANIISFKLL